MTKRSWRLAGLAVGLALLFAVVVLLLLHTGPARRYLLEKMQASLLDQGIQLEARGVSYNLVGAAVRLEGVTLTSVGAQGLPAFLEADSAAVNIGIISYLKGFLHLQDARFAGVKVRLVTDESGRTNLPVPPDRRPEPSGSLPDFLIEHLEASPVYLLYDNRAEQIRVELPSARLQIDGQMPFKHRVSFDGRQPGSIRFRGAVSPIDFLRLDAEVPGNLSSLALLDLQLRTADSQLRVSGRVENWTDPRMDLELRANLAVEQVARLATLQDLPGGTVVLTAKAFGTIADLTARADVAGHDLSYGPFRQVSLECTLDWDRQRESVRVVSLKIDAPDASLSGSGLVALSDEAGSSATLDIVRADLASLSRRLYLPIVVQSRASGRVAATWPGLQVAQVRGEAGVRLSPASSVVHQDRVPVGGSAKLRLDDGTLRASFHQLQVPGLLVEGNVQVDSFEELIRVADGRLSGQLHADVEDLALLYPNLLSFLGKSGDQTLSRIKPAGKAGLSAALAGTPSEPVVSASLDASALTVGPVSGIEATAQARITPARLDVQTFALRWRGQSADAKGSLGLSGPDSAIALDLDAENLDVRQALEMLGQTLPVSGSARLRAQATGTLGNPRAKARIQVSDLLAYDEAFGALHANLSFENQTAKVDELVLDKSAGSSDSSGELRLSGSYNLDSGSYELEANGDDLRVEGLRLPGQSPLAGVLTLSATGRGTFVDPGLDLSLELDEVKIEDCDIAPVHAEVVLKNRVASFGLTATSYQLQVNGQVGIQDPYPAQIEAQLSKTDLAALPPSLLGPDMQGSVTARLEARGDLARPRESEVQATISELVLKAGGQVIENQGSMQAGYSSEVLRVGNISLTSGSSFVALSGEMPLESSGRSGRVDIRGNVDVGELLAGHLGAPYSFDGKLALEGSVAGSFQSLAPTLSAVLHDGRFAAPQLSEPVQNINLQATIREGQLELGELTARLGSGRLTGQGRIPLGVIPGLPAQIQRKEGPAQLTLHAQDFSLGSLVGVPPDVSGGVSFQAELEAAEARVESLAGQLTFSRMDFRVAGIDLRQDRPARMLVNDGTVKIDHFALVGPETRIQAVGTVSLTGEREADLRANGRVDLALMSVLAQDLEASGESQFRFAVSGAAANPVVTGFITLEGAQVAIQTPSIQVNDLRARFELEGDGFTIREFAGNLNGGSLAASGSAALVDGVVTPNLEINARGVFLDFPEGLQTVSDADLTVRSAGDAVNIGGRIAIQQGSYTDQLNIEEELLGLAGSAQPAAISERDPLLARVRFNVDVESREPIVMDNNLAKLSADLDMQLVGNYYQPSLLGRLRLDEGGELYLRERTYYIERGVVSFNNPVEIEPTLDLSARTEVNDLDITLRISGTPADLQTSLTSDPPMPETDLASLLVTGRTLEEARGEAGTVLREQTLSLLTGAFGGRLEAGLEEITGLSKVRIEPSLISPESDPMARLTIGQDLTAKLGLIYSMNLADSSDRIYIGEYDVTRRFIGRVIHETDPQDALGEGTKSRFEVRHDLSFGGTREAGDGQPTSRPDDRREIATLRFEGQSPLTDEKLQDELGFEVGDRYDFFKVRRGLEEVKTHLVDRGYLETTVRLSREDAGPQSVGLTVRVVAGPEIVFRYEGFEPSGELERAVRESWSKGVFDELRLELAREAVLSALLLDGYMETRIEHEVQAKENRKQVTFRVQPGPHYEIVSIEFQGASSPVIERLEKQFGDQKAAAKAQVSFAELEQQIRMLYRSEGYLHAELSPPAPKLDPSSRSAVLVLPIREGPRAVLEQIRFEGNSVLTDADLGRTSHLVVGQIFRPGDADAAVVHLRLAYAAAGYNDAVVSADTQSSAETGKVRLGFAIQENRRDVVRALEVRGNGKTSERFVTSLLALSVGEPFTPDKVARSRRALYDTGAFALAELETEEIDWPEAMPGEKPLRVTVRVREVSPYRLQYGGFYDTERGVGAIADLTSRNILGNAAVLGLRARYDDTFREGRLYFSQPQLGGLPFDNTAAAFVSREIRLNAGFITDRVGFSIQQQKRLADDFLLAWGYRFERDHTYEPIPDAFFDIILKVAPLTATFSRDVRDDILDASRGSFTSHNLEYAPKFLGSDLRFMRYFGQYFHYIPLGEPREIPWSGGLRKSRLVYAGGVRVGLAHGFEGQRLVPSERFYAGGGTSIRGFEQDEVGPRSIIGDPAGGQSLFIMNHELRFPLYHVVDGVGFFDLGNVYRDVQDFDPFDLRSSVGFGLRIRTPYFLLRGDLGVNLSPREGERRSALFFSIGQAF